MTIYLLVFLAKKWNHLLIGRLVMKDLRIVHWAVIAGGPRHMITLGNLVLT